MSPIAFLLLFPLVIAILLLLIRSDRVRAPLVYVSATAIIIASVYTVCRYLNDGTTMFDFSWEPLGTLMFAVEVILCITVICLGYKYKKWAAPVLAVIQTAIGTWFELTQAGGLTADHNLYIDELSMIMVLIIGIIGSLITVYAVGYMKDFQAHDKSKDRRPWFFFVMYVFLSAMFGIVLSNNLMWMFFFWEITTFCSFFLIGYTRTDEAIHNAFLQLKLNIIGGIAFIVAIAVFVCDQHVVEMDKLLECGLSGIDVVLPVALLCLAGIVKAAQMPFQSWLLGAMVAPTPTSALLHSSTMVKAGVFLLLKLAPLLGKDIVGYAVMTVGALTFLLASMAAVSQSNAKRVLAYSTIANLGLIVACAGVGTYEAVWAGILLMIFHAITKSLMFLSVGTAEHHIGSRNIEDMDGLFERMPRLAAIMIIGIAGMFLIPFGMLISKWAALTTFVESENLVLIACLIFGSAVTSFYWTKWLGKLVGVVAHCENVEKTVHKDEWAVLDILTVLVIAVCFGFPLLSEYIVSPYLIHVFGNPPEAFLAIFGTEYVWILLAMLALLIILPIALLNKSKKPQSSIYMAGLNNGDNQSYTGSMGATVNVTLRNWYMESWFSNYRMDKIGVVMTVLVIVVTFALVLAGVTL